MTAGYYYIAINDSSIGALVYSAKRTKELDPVHPIAVATDTPIPEEHAYLFDQVIMVPHKIDLDGIRDLDAYPHQGLLGKCRYFYQSPWDVTIFLDNDIYLVETIEDLFHAAEWYDIAGAFDAGHSHYANMPEYFTMINTGMILYKKSEVIEQFMAAWWDNVVDHLPDPNDQSPFMLTLWEYRDLLKFLALPYEYNFRFIFPMYAWGTVKVLHGRFDGVPDVAKKINSINQAPRVWYWNNFVCWYDAQKGMVKN
jgi:hypothetical protein